MVTSAMMSAESDSFPKCFARGEVENQPGPTCMHGHALAPDRVAQSYTARPVALYPSPLLLAGRRHCPPTHRRPLPHGRHTRIRDPLVSHSMMTLITHTCFIRMLFLF